MAEIPPSDDLDRPLGTRIGTGDGGKFLYRRLAATGGAALAASLAALVYVASQRSGSDVVATVPVEIAAIVPAPPAPPPPASAAPAGAAMTGASTDITGAILAPKRSMTAAEIESRSGVNIVRAGGESAPPGALIIEVPPDLGVHLSPAPDHRLIERSPQGLLPKIGADGSRPAAVYARPVVLPPSLREGAPRIAVFVSGLGLSATGTEEAIRQLPGEITLAFAPYGAGLEARVAEARESGHEVLLQVPMEPFDYPADNPGPHTLLATDEPAQNLARLRWLMARFTGYVGIVNFLGGKFTAEAQAFRPILHELAERGLLYVDDGTSKRSTADDIAADLALPLVHTDVVIDTVDQQGQIDAALARLESVARAKGMAVGSATGLPLTIDRLTHWVAELKGHGIALVPVSAAAGRRQNPSAEGSTP